MRMALPKYGSTIARVQASRIITICHIRTGQSRGLVSENWNLLMILYCICLWYNSIVKLLSDFLLRASYKMKSRYAIYILTGMRVITGLLIFSAPTIALR
jgi:hypothetical protein